MRLNRARSARTNDAGFTLVELLMVMVIVGILAGIGVSGFSTLRERANQAEADSAWRELNMAMNLYRVDEGDWPPEYRHAASLGFLDNPWGPLEVNLAPGDEDNADDPLYDMQGANGSGGPVGNLQSGHMILDEGGLCVWANGVASSRNSAGCP